MIENYTVSNLPVPIFKECRKIEEIHYAFLKGDDPFFVETNEVKKTMIEHQENIDNEIAERQETPPEPRFSKNVEELSHLTEMIQADIFNVIRPNLKGNIRHDRFIEESNQRFLDSGIPLYASQLVIFIESLIIEDGFSPESFRGYRHLATLIRESNGLTKMNHLLELMNKVRKIIPPNLHTENSFVVDSNSIDPNKMNEG